MAVEVTVAGAPPELFSEYVEYKRNLGYVYPNSRVYLVKRLSRFLAGRAADERVLTREAAEAFARPCDGESSGSAAGRRGVARQFALFLRWKGIDAWVLPEHGGPRQPSSFAPRIITADEMARVIACADARPASRCGPQTQPVYAMLVRLLWCCGLRIGEALSLRVGDVSLAEAIVTVRKAKHNRARLVPMSESLAAHAQRYAVAVGLVPEDPAAWFFPSPRGGGYNPGSATAHIQGLMLEAGVTTASGRAPRTHDLRHSYAVASLAKMQADGVDVYAALPLLATYMGHADIASAEYYLRLDPSAWATIEQAMEGTYASVFPHGAV
ncbi:MAG: tyrosine-type recombinase/integrase [Acidimicrobiales bacterium]|uniref:tyrosine-type recombinase/integrase n=1 Tax=Mycobacterium sp. TaxID=1785 RepID=UPI003F99D148